jgi:hypothetical protein
MNILNKHYCHITKPTHTLAVKLGTETTATCGAETAYHPGHLSTQTDFGEFVLLDLWFSV